jgi:hypothetical protein
VSTAFEPNVPFRWDLITPSQLGTLLDGAEPPDLWFLDELVACAGKVLARSGNGDLFFVGRSLDSMYDLLGGALADTDWRHRLHRVPFSFQRTGRWVGNRWRPRRITRPEWDRARQLLIAAGLSPRALARRDRAATFVDVVHGGSTFTELFILLRPWIDRDREPWNAIRRKLRFVGVVFRTKTSPNTYRWHQHTPWIHQLPARAVLNVSLAGDVWSYLGNTQIKLTRTFRPEDWLAAGDGPQRGEDTRLALAEAYAIVQYGRSVAGRRALARATDGEPALAEAWLRSLVAQLNRA